MSSEAKLNNRSCVACAQRKVRCDKQFPCGRCQRTGVRCFPPAPSQRPRWARKLSPASTSQAHGSKYRSALVISGTDKILDRLAAIEELVRDQVADSLSSPASDLASLQAEATSPPKAPRDSGGVRDLSSSFWYRIRPEISSLREEILNSSTERQDISAGPHPVAEHESTHIDRYAFLSRQSSTVHHGVSELFPMASQVPFLLDIYTEKVHFIIGIPHLGSLKSLLRRNRLDPSSSNSPSEDALILAVFYAAICSMDEAEVLAGFNTSQQELSMRFRTGMEHSLARADFLNKPTYGLVEAMVLYLTLARLREPPKFMYMMIGIVIRMARLLGYHHDGSASENISPFQTEMQRRLWWNICVLDLQASEDQGTELAIASDSFSTKLPSNIDEEDLTPDMDHPPARRQILSTASLLQMCSKITRTTQQMMAASRTDTFDDRVQRLNGLAQELDQDYFALQEASQHTAYLAASGTLRLFVNRMTLLAFLPALFSSPNAVVSAPLRNKLLVAAIEMLELNHALNTDPSCQPWRWVYQTQRLWHAIVFVLLEACRRSWSPVTERAWSALQSPWLLPTHAASTKNSEDLIPFKRLMARARQHRHDEIKRLCANPSAATRLENEDRLNIPALASSKTFPVYFHDEDFYQKWRGIVRAVPGADAGSRTSESNAPTTASIFNLRDAPVYEDFDHHPAAAVVTPCLGSADPNTSLYGFIATDSNWSLESNPMNEDDLLNFDWNTWLASTSDTT